MENYPIKINTSERTFILIMQPEREYSINNIHFHIFEYCVFYNNERITCSTLKEVKVFAELNDVHIRTISVRYVGINPTNLRVYTHERIIYNEDNE